MFYKAMTEKIRALWRKHRQLAAYCIAGGLTTLVDNGLFYLMRYQWNFNENLANALSTIIAILFAYAANKIYVFRTRCANLQELVREMFSFFAARGVTLAVQLAGGFVLMTVMDVNEMISKLGLTVLILILNFVFSKLFVFRDRDVCS